MLNNPQVRRAIHTMKVRILNKIYHHIYLYHYLINDRIIYYAIFFVK